jgi:hypothetical protein
LYACHYRRTATLFKSIKLSKQGRKFGFIQLAARSHSAANVDGEGSHLLDRLAYVRWLDPARKEDWDTNPFADLPAYFPIMYPASSA